MAVFNFTVRATDSEGSFADRAFNINVRNSKVERYMSITTTDAYTSVDGNTWTLRAGMGGIACSYGNGFWLIQTTSGFRKSFDGVNYSTILRADTTWTTHTGTVLTSGLYPTFAATSPKVRFINGKFILPHLNAGTGNASNSWGSLNTVSGVWVSDDGINWVLKAASTAYTGGSSIPTTTVWQVSEDNGTIILNNPMGNAANNATLGYISSDAGATWTTIRNLAGLTNANADFLFRFNGLYIAMNIASHAYLYSSDGANWTSGSIATGNSIPSNANATSQPIQNIVYANGRLYAFTYKTSVASFAYAYHTSTDGINWTYVGTIKSFTNATNGNIYINRNVSLFKNGVFLLGSPNSTGANNTTDITLSQGGLRFSTNGTTWTTVNQYNTTGDAPIIDIAVM